MIPYYGDFAEDATVRIPFNTFSSDDPTASVTITNLADADIKVHKDGGLTQIATDGATIAIDYDGITGNHMITIDTSVHADYTTGADYQVRIEGTTVDAGTINAFVGTFSIQNRYNAAADDLANVTDGLGALKTILDAILVDTGTTIPGTITTMQNDLDIITDSDGVILGAAGVDLIWDEVLTGGTHNVANSSGRRLRAIDSAFGVHAGTAQAGSATTITLDTGASATDDIYNGDRIIITAGTGAQEHGLVIDYNGTTKVATMSKAWIITPDATSEFVVAPADCDIETWNHTAVTGDGDWTGLVGSGFSTSTDSLEAIRNRGDAAWTTGAGGTPPQLLQSTTIATLASQTSFTLTAGSSDDDAYNGAVVVVTDQSTATQKAVGSVSDYTGSTKTVTLSADPAIFTMAVGDTIDVIANASTAPSAAAVRAEMDANSTQLAAIVADTNELQTDWANGGRLDLILDATATASALATVDTNVDAILVDTGTTLPATLSDMSGATFNTSTDSLEAIRNRGDAAWTTGAGGTAPTVIEIRQEMDANSTQLAAIVADTNELQTDWVNGGRLDLILDATATQSSVDIIDANVDAILVDTGTTLPATLATASALATVDSNVDTLVTGVNATSIDGSVSAAVNLKNHALRAVPVTFSGGTTTTAVLVNVDGAAASSTDDVYNGRVFIFSAPSGLKDSACTITDYVGSTKTATITALTSAVSASSVAVMV